MIGAEIDQPFIEMVLFERSARLSKACWPLIFFCCCQS